VENFVISTGAPGPRDSTDLELSATALKAHGTTAGRKKESNITWRQGKAAKVATIIRTHSPV
jgi:hypothetical protein